MSVVKSPVDFARKIAQTLGVSEETVKNYFEFGEDEKGWFYAKKYPKRWLERARARAFCILPATLGFSGVLKPAFCVTP